MKTRKKISGIVSDVDGTLVIHGQNLPTKPVQAAVSKLDIPFLVASGRSYALIKNNIVPSLNLRHLATLDGGATVNKAGTGEVLWSNWLEPHLIEKVVRNIGAKCTLLSCQEAYLPFSPSEVEVDNFSAKAASPSVFGVYNKEYEEAIDYFLKELPGISYRLMQYETHIDKGCYQVTADGVNKATGSAIMLEKAGLTNERILVFGDGLRDDLPLFQQIGERGIKIAMGNAPELLKDHADFVTDSVEEDGVVKAMKHYGVLK